LLTAHTVNGYRHAMANLAKDLETATAALGETIESCVLGTHYNLMCQKGDGADKAPRKQILTWEAARPWLDEEYSNGFGGADCRPFFAYTQKWVWFVHEYDGATGICRVPRNPMSGVAPSWADIDEYDV
jgi:hypothetical protein